MQFLDKYGWPVERIEGRPITNLIRLFLHTRKIVRRWEPEGLYALAKALGESGMPETDIQEMMMSSPSVFDRPERDT